MKTIKYKWLKMKHKGGKAERKLTEQSQEGWHKWSWGSKRNIDSYTKSIWRNNNH